MLHLFKNLNLKQFEIFKEEEEMSNKYLIWKNPNETEGKKEWIELKGEDFYKFIKSPEAKDRYFTKFPSLLEDGKDKTIIIESTKEEYEDWSKKERHKRYLRNCEVGFSTISYNALESDDDSNSEELLRDESKDVPTEVEMIMNFNNLTEALSILSVDERWLIDELYLCDITKSECELSRQSGIPQKTINNRKIAILKKIKKILK